jgi:hypothetical protein
MWEMSKHSIRFGGSGKPSAASRASTIDSLLGVLLDEFEERVFLATLGIQDFHAMAGLFGQHFFKKFTVFKTEGCVDKPRKIFCVEIKLF